MLTNNYFKACSIFSSHYNDLNSFQWIDVGMVDINGEQAGDIFYSTTNITRFIIPCSYMYAPRLNLQFIVGTGDTEETLEDYALENDITSSISYFDATTTTTSVNGALKTVVTITGINLTGESITLREIGVTKRYYCYIESAVSESNYKTILLLRHVLDEPKEIANGEGFTLSFEWTES